MRYTVEVTEHGTHWYKEGTDILHRENGPAVEWSSGYKEWWLNDKRHRENGPAIEHVNNGHKRWYLNNQLHREDGPAIERSDGDKEWFLNGEELTEEEFNAKTKASCNGKIVEIDGKKFKLVEV